MNNTDDAQIYVPYNQDLKPLEELLARVRRPGDFFVRGALETPMPRVEVEGVGVLSFPIPASQVRDIIHRAERAPYGRGGETILDTSVREAWQLAPAQVRIGGKSWKSSFQQILSTVMDGMGCAEMDVSAELYKLLVYEEGGFFLAHRDTEKADGMFGTLIIVLPSVHRGGELVIRHAGREVILDLSNPEVSELTFAAFYADCEHEVKPITQGSRVCLTYNLIKRGTNEKDEPLAAPLYDAEVKAAAALLKTTFNESGGSAKLAWLLKHHYSPAGLSLAELKGEDRALAKVLQRAADQAECAVHLGIVHIEESGAAEPVFTDYRRGRRWERYRVAEEETDREDFEVIEVSEASRCIDQWMDTADRAVDFGKLPIEDGEVVPAGALDDEAPDKQRLTEATGNEGASFERSYHRAALVIWPQDRFADVLLQAGPGAALPYLKDRIQECSNPEASTADREVVASIASRILDVWEGNSNRSYSRWVKEPDRSAMTALLGQLADLSLLERFCGGVLTREYDGSENDALAANAWLLGPKKAGQLLSQLVCENMHLFAGACLNLLTRLIGDAGAKSTADCMAALRDIAAAIVEALPKLEKQHKRSYADRDWRRALKAKPVDAGILADLLDSLTVLNTQLLRDAACTAIAANPCVFDPATVIVPALELLGERTGNAFSSDAECRSLWCHAAEFLLARSEYPPEPPKDWHQNVEISCQCTDCRELQAFVLDPREQTHRFRVRQERRQHLHATIGHHDLDMTHVTERVGSPQTLVCTKTRRTYERHCGQHEADIASMLSLLPLMDGARGPIAALSARMEAAKDRHVRARSRAV